MTLEAYGSGAKRKSLSCGNWRRSQFRWVTAWREKAVSGPGRTGSETPVGPPRGRWVNRLCLGWARSLHWQFLWYKSFMAGSWVLLWWPAVGYSSQLMCRYHTTLRCSWAEVKECSGRLICAPHHPQETQMWLCLFQREAGGWWSGKEAWLHIRVLQVWMGRIHPFLFSSISMYKLMVIIVSLMCNLSFLLRWGNFRPESRIGKSYRKNSQLGLLKISR